MRKHIEHRLHNAHKDGTYRTVTPKYNDDGGLTKVYNNNELYSGWPLSAMQCQGEYSPYGSFKS